MPHFTNCNYKWKVKDIIALEFLKSEKTALIPVNSKTY